MSAVRLPKLALTAALAIGLAMACAFSKQDAAAQTVRDHRARVCRVGYDAYPRIPGNPFTIATCNLPSNNTQVIGSFCTCMVLIEGRYTTVGGSIVHA